MLLTRRWLFAPLTLVMAAVWGGAALGATCTWEKVYDRPADSATVIEMFDGRYGLAIIGHGIE